MFPITGGDIHGESLQDGVTMPSNRSGGGVRLQSHRVKLLGQPGSLVVALLFVIVTALAIDDVHCSVTTDAVAPAPAPSTQQTETIVSFNQYEADALNAIFRKWSKANPQLSSLFNWSLDEHPCNDLTFALRNTTVKDFSGAWIGVRCSSELQNLTEIPKHYHISVTSIWIFGTTCTYYGNREICGFDGITGELPLELSNLTNLHSITIANNPMLTGPVPVEIFQLPNLTDLSLYNNFLSGTLPSDIYRANCKLQSIDLSKNNFSGSLRVSSQGTVFCGSLNSLNLAFNQLDGPIDFQNWNVLEAIEPPLLYLNNNHFNGIFSTGPFFNAFLLDLSNNDLNGMQLAKYIGTSLNTSLDTLYMPSLRFLNMSSNNFNGLFFDEFFRMTSLQDLDLSKNNFFGSIGFEGFKTLKFLNNLFLNNNNFNGTFSIGVDYNTSCLDLSNNQFNNITFHQDTNIFTPKLQYLYFQNNSLKGDFPSDILTTPSLQILDASQNQYEALQLPDVRFQNSSISRVFITSNRITSIKPSTIGPFSPCNLQYSNVLFLGSNPICSTIRNPTLSSVCRSNPSDQALPVLQKSNEKMKVIIATSTSSSLALVILITTIFAWRLMGRIKALHIILQEFEKKEVKPNLYSYKEIKLATNNFDKDNELGEGGFGIVYKGQLFDGTQAAVKKLTMSSNQVLSEFLNEVIVISGLKHCNLVKLKGCCLGDGDQRILVLEYVENKNLAQALWRDGDVQNNFETICLDWKTRFNIIVGIAKGLAYLHDELQPPIIHRDIKATNILLDENYNAKIADFGLAYLLPSLDMEASHLTLMQVAGTRGYCSPEYAIHGHVSTALDVYSFGILVLEIISGRKNIDLQKANEEVYLREWAWTQYEAKATMSLIDAKMEHSSSDLDAIMGIIIVALACVHHKASRRPKMHNVVSMISGNMSISEFRREFEDGKAIGEICIKFPLTVGTTSSFQSSSELLINDCYPLSNISDIEMKSLVR